MIIVLANGVRPEWPDRHFVEIDGEPLIHRIVRQFSAHDDVIVSGPDLRYHIPPAALLVPRVRPENLDADILLSTEPLWADDTTVLLGDVWFSDAAVGTIMQRVNGLTFYGREHGSKYSGTDWGEIFAYRFPASDAPRLKLAALRVRDLQAAGVLWRGGLWEIYREIVGVPHDEHRIAGRFVEIDDDTDDFDFPDVLEAWRASHAV